MKNFKADHNNMVNSIYINNNWSLLSNVMKYIIIYNILLSIEEIYSIV